MTNGDSSFPHLRVTGWHGSYLLAPLKSPSSSLSPYVSIHSPFLGTFSPMMRTLHQQQQSLRRPGEDCSDPCGTASASALVELGTKSFYRVQNFCTFLFLIKSRKVLTRNKLIIISRVHLIFSA